MKQFSDYTTTFMHTSRFYSILLLLFLASCRAEGSFKPDRTPSPAGSQSAGPLSLSFAELDADPAAYVNQNIRVSGRYAPLPPPNCARVRGPDLRWALIEEGLRLDALGLEAVVLFIPEGLTLTVEGIWRHYQGPLGCGKEPHSGEIWYLQVTRLLQPNPLALQGMPRGAGGSSPRATLPPIEGGSPTASATPGPVQSPTASPTDSEATAGTPTVTPTQGTQTPTLQPSQTPPPTGTPRASPTQLPGESGTGTSTPTETVEPSPTASGLRTPTPPSPTNTPGAYPNGPPSYP